MAAIRIWDAQKGAQLQDTFGGGCAWYTVRMFITADPVADCLPACSLIKRIDAEYLLTDKGYDSDALVESLQQADINTIIPPRKCRKRLRPYEKYLYPLRHFIENAFLELKPWRGITTRYAKNTASFLAAVHIRCKPFGLKLNDDTT